MAPTELERALAAFGLDPGAARAEPIPSGLINQSFAVRGDGVEYVLQRVSPIFAPDLGENLRAVTAHLAARGVETPRLVPAPDGAPHVEVAGGGRWRLLTRVAGVVADTCQAPGRARSAGALVARFHAALADLDVALRPLGIVLHDSAAHLRSLADAVVAHAAHPLHGEVKPVAEAVLAAADELGPPPEAPLRVCHGDLKFNNVLFAAADGPGAERAVALIDLDTVSRLPLWAELGDAWRSWCNRAGEDAAEAALDVEIHRAAVEGYLEGAAAGPAAPGPAERASLLDAPERVALELAARFAADALEERYFGWDPARFASRGEHNLLRARGQLDLARQLRVTRAQRARVLGVEPPPRG